MDEIGNRVQRETDYYDGGRLDREKLERALDFVNQGIGRDRRNDIIRQELQDAHGKQVLEVGSQAWEWCLYRYGYRPDSLTCINISEAELEIGRRHAASLDAEIIFRNMDAHNLQFDDESLDIVFGVAILHHLDFGRAVAELHRVLRPGGKILFVEPLLLNPVARLARWWTPEARTPDERPLGLAELAEVDHYFTTSNYYSELFLVLGGILSRPFCRTPVNPITRFCDRVDYLLLRLLPRLGPFYRSVVIRGYKK